MRDIEPKIKPLYRDLKEVSIGVYLASTDFDRHALKNNLEKIWNQAIEAFDRENSVVMLGYDMTSFDRQEALRILMNWAIRSSQSDFNSIIAIILSGFIEWNNKEIDLEKVFEDLDLSGMQTHLIAELRGKHEARLKIIKSIQSCKEENEIETVEIKHEPNEFIESNKTAWIDQVAKGEIQNTLEDIKNFAQEVNNRDLIKNVINLSSRWHRIRNTYLKGTIQNEEKEREINKINEALIDLIMEIE